MNEIVKSDDVFLEEQARAYKYAQTLSDSDLVPSSYRGKPANCLIALGIAKDLGVSFFTAVNSIDIIMGKPTYKSTFLIAMINKSKLFKTPLMVEFEGEGKTRKAIAKAERVDGHICQMEASMEMAIKEGWTSKKGSKYHSMPDLMLTYRAATFFARVFCPEITLGLHTVEELQDMEKEKKPIKIDNDSTQSSEDIKRLLGG